MHDICITLFVLLSVAVFYHGPHLLITFSLSVASAFLLEFAGLRLIGQKKHEKYDYSHIITSLIITLLLPAPAPFWIAPVGVILALFVAKFPFGGLGHNIFNPAAVGLGFLGICWPEIVFKYCEPCTRAFGLLKMDFTAQSSPLRIIANSGTPRIQTIEALLGNFPGPVGATPVLVLAACGFYLLIRKTISLEIPLTLFVVSSLFAIFNQRVTTGMLNSLKYETIAGILIFGAVFMANDPSTTPKTSTGRFIFGALLGALGMMFRYYDGTSEYGFIYALLIMNALSDFCDSLGKKTLSLTEKSLLILMGFVFLIYEKIKGLFGRLLKICTKLIFPGSKR